VFVFYQARLDHRIGDDDGLGNAPQVGWGRSPVWTGKVEATNPREHEVSGEKTIPLKTIGLDDAGGFART
jgi:hypothetical protein